MPYIEMDPELIQKAIEGYEDELTPEFEKLEAFYRQFRCKRCGGSCKKEIDVRHAFADENSLVPRSLLRCVMCNFLFDPHSGIVLEIGDDPVPILNK